MSKVSSILYLVHLRYLREENSFGCTFGKADENISRQVQRRNPMQQKEGIANKINETCNRGRRQANYIRLTTSGDDGTVDDCEDRIGWRNVVGDIIQGIYLVIQLTKLQRWTRCSDIMLTNYSQASTPTTKLVLQPSYSLRGDKVIKLRRLDQILCH